MIAKQREGCQSLFRLGVSVDLETNQDRHRLVSRPAVAHYVGFGYDGRGSASRTSPAIADIVSRSQLACHVDLKADLSYSFDKSSASSVGPRLWQHNHDQPLTRLWLGKMRLRHSRRFTQRRNVQGNQPSLLTAKARCQWTKPRYIPDRNRYHPDRKNHRQHTQRRPTAQRS